MSKSLNIIAERFKEDSYHIIQKTLDFDPPKEVTQALKGQQILVTSLGETAKFVGLEKSTGRAIVKIKGEKGQHVYRTRDIATEWETVTGADKRVVDMQDKKAIDLAQSVKHEIEIMNEHMIHFMVEAYSHAKTPEAREQIKQTFSEIKLPDLKDIDLDKLVSQDSETSDMMRFHMGLPMSFKI